MYKHWAVNFLVVALAGVGSSTSFRTFKGTMLVIDDLAAIARANDLCNRLGLDTISASATIAFAFEAFENSLISTDETEGVSLAWESRN